MSSFKRKVKKDIVEAEPGTKEEENFKSSLEKVEEVNATEPIRGVRPWIHGNHVLASSGHRQLDELLGGGVPAGTSILYIYDEGSNYCQTLLNYHLSESISHAHQTLLIVQDGFEVEGIMRSLPYNSSIGKGDTNFAEPDEKIEASGDWGLKIAWQYQKYLDTKQSQPKRAGHSEKIPYCCSYDLSRRFQQSLLQTNFSIHLIESSPKNNFEELLYSLLSAIRKLITDQQLMNSKNMTRVFLPNLTYLVTYPTNDQEFDLLYRFLLKLKRLIRLSKIIVVFGVATGIISQQRQLAIETIIDTVIKVDSFAGRQHAVPYEFQDFCGFFAIRKVHQYGLLAAQQLKGTKFGLKRDRRKLHIEPLHLPPEDNRATSSSVAREEMLKQKTEEVRVTTVSTTKSKADQNKVPVAQSSQKDNTGQLTPLQQSLAAARQAREAAKLQSSSGTALPRPISISVKPIDQAKSNLDF